MRLHHIRQTVPVAVLAAGSLLVPTVLMAPDAGAFTESLVPSARAGVAAKTTTSSNGEASSASSAKSGTSGKADKTGKTDKTGKSGKSGKSSKSSRAGTSGKAAKTSGLTSGAAAGLRAHIVGSGDTVVGIAKQYGVSPDSVRAANGIVGDRLYLGARVIIDGSAGSNGSASSGSASNGSGAASQASGTSSKRSSKTSTASSRIAAKSSAYTIEDGDTLSDIADEHGVSLKALLAANDLKATSLILPGDKISVPGSSSFTGNDSAGSTSSSTATSGASATDSSSSGPSLRCPVPGETFMNDWGFPRDDGGRFHEGTDLFARKGTTIVAPAAGEVTFAKNGLGGSTFTIQTATGWEIYGAHLNSTIGSSRSVKAGEAIATVGNSGNAAGGDTHLHMGLKRIGGRSMNPYPALRSACG